MDAAAVQDYLHTHIPLSQAMGVRVLEATAARITLAAPLEPNINHRETVFGGSAASLATLAAWALLRVRLHDAGLDGRLVIQHSVMSYDRPIPGAFTAVAEYRDTAEWQRFLQTLTRKRRARIKLTAALQYQNETAARFEGDFVAALPPTAG
jgi:thioesterase domain-containing protein